MILKQHKNPGQHCPSSQCRRRTVGSLGCENNDLEHFLPVLGEIDESRVKMMVTQDVEGDELEYGMELIRELAQELAPGPTRGCTCEQTKNRF